MTSPAHGNSTDSPEPLSSPAPTQRPAVVVSPTPAGPPVLPPDDDETLIYAAATEAAKGPLPADRPNRPHPGYGLLLKPLDSDGGYATFGTRGAYTPFPTDVKRFHRDPKNYPGHAYHGPVSYQTWYVDPRFWSLPTSVPGVSQGNAIEEAIWDLGCVCGLGVMLTANPAAAGVRFHFADPMWIVGQSNAWDVPFRGNLASSYLTIRPGTGEVYLSHVNKQDLKTPQAPNTRKRIWGHAFLMLLGVPYDGLPRHLSPYAVDEPYLWGGAKNWQEYPAMRNPNMSAPIEHLEGWGYWNHGYDSWEIGRVRSAYGQQPWLYRWDRAVK